MAALDFKEIPEAKGGKPGQDKFEQFARDFLIALGLIVQEGPDRGADGGRDLIAVEQRAGAVGVSERRWLVSCKHKAHSGSSVTPNDEDNILDRVESHNCTGFMGIYSTLPSAGLAERLVGLGKKIETKVFDGEQLESFLLTEPTGASIARRYFPKSYGVWSGQHPEVAKLFADQDSLYCKGCGKDLLEPKIEGNLCFVSRYPETEQTLAIYWTCKECDYALQRAYEKSFAPTEISNTWRDLADLGTPVLFIKAVMAFLNKLQAGKMVVAESTFNDLKTALLTMFTRVARQQNTDDRERIETDMSLPPGI